MIPFMEYLKAYDGLSKRTRILYGIMFMIMFFTPLLLPQVYIPHMLIILFMACREIYKVFAGEIVPFFKSKKAVKTA